ncbi:MAG TPA: helix-turn-helix transcriptional regulator [Vicinamibacterales bacterium]|jgi:transcriptional regulator with XRE-family HTH domain
MQEHAQAIRKRVGKNVKRLRQARGWSQAALAELVGNNEKHIGQIERGQVNAGINTLAALAYRFGVNVIELFAESNDARRQRPRTLSKEQYSQFEELVRMAITLRDGTQRTPRRRSR